MNEHVCCQLMQMTMTIFGNATVRLKITFLPIKKQEKKMRLIINKDEIARYASICIHLASTEETE